MVECHCPALGDGGDAECICTAQFDWWWNMQCASFVSIRNQPLGDSLTVCQNRSASWSLVAGNVSMEHEIESDSGACPAQGAACSHELRNLSISTRRIGVELRLAPGACANQQRITWSLPIEATLQCANVDQIFGPRLCTLLRTERGALCAMLCMNAFENSAESETLASPLEWIQLRPHRLLTPPAPARFRRVFSAPPPPSPSSLL